MRYSSDKDDRQSTSSLCVYAYDQTDSFCPSPGEWARMGYVTWTKLSSSSCLAWVRGCLICPTNGPARSWQVEGINGMRYAAGLSRQNASARHSIHPFDPFTFHNTKHTTPQHHPTHSDQTTLHPLLHQQSRPFHSCASTPLLKLQARDLNKRALETVLQAPTVP